MNKTPGMDVITILKITQTSERFIKLDFISPNQGLTYGLLRLRKKFNDTAHADLFDTAEIQSEVANHSKQKFLKSYTPLHKRSAIGNDYQQLKHACHFATFLIDNVADVPDPSDIYTLTTQTLDAFELKFRPEIILFKTLYRFLKTEGFPIYNGWWQSLTKENKSRAKILLATPLEELKNSPDLETVPTLHKLLCKWAQKETELKIKTLYL